MADLISVYLQNHLAAARGGIELFRRVTANHRQSPIEGDLAGLTTEVDEDLRGIRDLAEKVGARENILMSAVSKVGERVGRLKPNGSLLHRTPLTSVIELEALRDAVAAKAAGWDALAVAAATDDRIDGDVIESWQARAADQTRRLIDLHARVAEVAFGVASTDHRPTTTGPAVDRSS